MYIALERHRSANVWFGDQPDCILCASALVVRSMSAGSTSIPAGAVVVELCVPVGPYSLYGLLGATFTPLRTADLTIRVGICESGPSYVSTLTHGADHPRVVLPRVFANTVADVAGRYQETGQILSAGTLSFDRAVCGDVGSAPVIFGVLATACMRLLAMDRSRKVEYQRVASIVAGAIDAGLGHSPA